MNPKTAVLSDIHGSSPALRAVLADVDAVGCEQVVVLGDTVLGIDPLACLDALLERGDVLHLQGTHESWALVRDLDGFPGREGELESRVADTVALLQRRLAPRQAAALAAMPPFVREGDALLVHDQPEGRLRPETRRVPGLAREYWDLYYHPKGIYPAMNEEEERALVSILEELGVGLLLCGHTHLPFVRRVGATLVCNVGSAGLPLDGDPRPSWVALDRSGAAPSVNIRRCEYDPEETISIMMRSGGPFLVKDKDAHARMLRTGDHWKPSVAEWTHRAQLPYV